MEIQLDQNILVITTDKKQVRFDGNEPLDVDGLHIEMPGEYEKSGILVQTRLID